MAEDRNLTIDWKEFELLMQRAQVNVIESVLCLVRYRVDEISHRLVVGSEARTRIVFILIVMQWMSFKEEVFHVQVIFQSMCTHLMPMVTMVSHEVITKKMLVSLLFTITKTEFESCEGTILALRCNNKYVSEVGDGELAGVVLDKTCFHAEQGGQIADEGFIVKAGEKVDQYYNYYFRFIIMIFSVGNAIGCC